MKILKLLFLFVLSLSFAGCTKHQQIISRSSIPVTNGDGWQVASPASQNIDILIIDKADKILKNDSSFANIHTLTIARNGKLVLDRFYHSGPFGYRQGGITTMMSVTKSFTSIVVGIAMDKSLIKGINKTAQSLLPGLQNIDWTNGKDKITLKNILTMSAGFAGNKGSDSLLPEHFAQYMFSKPMAHVPGSTFDYRTALTNTLGDILTSALNTYHVSLEKFMDSLLFNPLDITNYQWYYRSGKGEPELGGGLFLTPRDMIKLGQLILDKGKWNNKQIVSEKWIAEATKEYFHFNKRYWGEMDGYGYLFWLRTLTSNGKTFQAIIALGYGGQYIVVIPALHTTIAITSWFPNDKSWYFPLQFIEQYILPALKQ